MKNLMKFIKYVLLICLSIAFVVHAQSQSKHSLGVNIGLNNTFRSLTFKPDNGPISLIHIYESRLADKAIIQGNLALDYYFEVSKRFRLITGINYTNLGHNYVNGQFRFPDEHNGDGGFIEKENLRHYFDFKALEFPVGLQFYLWTKKSSIYLDTRLLSTVLLTKNEVETYTFENESVKRKLKYSETNFILGTGLSLGMKFPLSSTLELNIQPNLKFYFTEIESFLFFDRVYSFGVNIGAEYHF